MSTIAMERPERQMQLNKTKKILDSVLYQLECQKSQYSCDIELYSENSDMSKSLKVHS